MLIYKVKPASMGNMMLEKNCWQFVCRLAFPSPPPPQINKIGFRGGGHFGCVIEVENLMSFVACLTRSPTMLVINIHDVRPVSMGEMTLDLNFPSPSPVHPPTLFLLSPVLSHTYQQLCFFRMHAPFNTSPVSGQV